MPREFQPPERLLDDAVRGIFKDRRQVAQILAGLRDGLAARNVPPCVIEGAVYLARKRAGLPRQGPDLDVFRRQAESHLGGLLDGVVDRRLGPDDADAGTLNALFCAFAWHSDPRREVSFMEVGDISRLLDGRGPIGALMPGDGVRAVFFDWPLGGEVAFMLVSHWREPRVFPLPEPWWSRTPDGGSLTDATGMLRVSCNYTNESDGGMAMRHLSVRASDSLQDVYDAEGDHVQKLLIRAVGDALGLGGARRRN